MRLLVVVVLELKVVKMLSNEKWAQLPQITGLIAKKTPIKVPIEYADFAFFPDLASELSEHTEINDHAIKLVDANFIRLSKSPAGVLR